MSYSQFDVRQIVPVLSRINSGHATGRQTLVSFSAAPLILTDISVANSDTIDHVVNLDHYDGTNHRRLGSVTVPARQGYDGTPGLFLGETMLPPNWQGWAGISPHTLTVSVDVAMTGTTVLDVVGMAGYL